MRNVSIFAYDAGVLIIPPAILKRLKALPCGTCSAIGSHFYLAVDEDSFEALCYECYAQLGQNPRQDAAQPLHPASAAQVPS